MTKSTAPSMRQWFLRPSAVTFTGRVGSVNHFCLLFPYFFKDLLTSLLNLMTKHEVPMNICREPHVLPKSLYLCIASSRQGRIQPSKISSSQCFCRRLTSGFNWARHVNNHASAKNHTWFGACCVLLASNLRSTDFVTGHDDIKLTW